MITIDGQNFYDENFGVQPDGVANTGSYGGKANHLSEDLIPPFTDQEIYDKDCTSITIAEGDFSLLPGAFVKLHINASPVTSNVPEVIWETSNFDVAFVTSEGVLYAQTAGEATIKATNSEDTAITTSITVTVTEEGGEETVYLFTSWDSAGETKANEGKLKLTGETLDNLMEVEITESTPDESIVGQKYYISSEATPDGETLYPLYNSSKEDTGTSVKLSEEE